MFRYDNSTATINNERGKVIEIVGGIDAENRNIGLNSKNNKIHQQWDVIYVD
jgi:hypothetical protein